MPREKIGPMSTIQVTPTLTIDERERAFPFARASGPGGQNVNHRATTFYIL